MVFSQVTTQIGEVNSISFKTNYVHSPLSLFAEITKNRNHALLLESAEIDSKDNLKSLMLIDTAVKFVCNGQQVTINALVENGRPVIQYLHEHFLKNTLVQTKLTDNETLLLSFEQLTENLNEDQRLKQANAFEVIRTVINSIKCPKNSPFSLFLGGVFSYDMLANFESLPQVEKGPNTCPDYEFYLAETMLVIDHQNQTSELIGNVFSGENAYACCFSVGKRLEQLKQLIEQNEYTTDVQSYGFGLAKTEEVKVNIDDESFKRQVLKLKQHIIEGDIFQVVPSRCFSIPCQSPLDAYRHLKHDNPSPYMFYLKSDSFVLFGASPESALKYNSQTNQVEVYPIAGTRKRGFNANGTINFDLDSRIELDLRNDKKEVAEHTMLVDLARNDVARISQRGTRHVKELLKVDRYSYVMHLVSRVVGQLREDLDAIHAYQACMNMGTLVGAPKLKAAELIRQTEKTQRGSYGGAVGYLNGEGDMDTCIVIRSAFVQNNLAHVQAGAGVVFDSDPESELQETVNKAQAVLNAIQASQALIRKDSN